MAAYVIVDNEVTNQAVFAEYVEKIPQVVAAHGGRYLVRGGATEVVHGNQTPHRVVVMEFESLDAARGFVNSAEYRQLADLRERGSVTTTFIVEGV